MHWVCHGVINSDNTSKSARPPLSKITSSIQCKDIHSLLAIMSALHSPLINSVVQFWFEEIDSSCWFEQNDSFDAMLRDRFAELHRQACHGELFGWRDTALGRLAEILILDQFSRNLYRHQPQAFAFDGMALVLAQAAITAGAPAQLTLDQRRFLYMPFMHSESLAIHDIALHLFSEPGMEFNLDYEQQHRAIIARFGRYPHRNQVLGRHSSAEELAFLAEPGSSF